MKRLIRANAEYTTRIYHGDRGRNPKLINQKELGFHFGSLEEAQLHGKFIFYIDFTEPATSTITVKDPNNWASYEGLIAIYKQLDPTMSLNEIRNIWTSWNVDTNSREASQLIRQILNDNGITCIKYIDTEDIPGEQCYILLYQPKLIRCSFKESFPELYDAITKVENDYNIDLQLSQRFEGDYYIMCKNPNIDYEGPVWCSAVNMLGRLSNKQEAYDKLIKLL